MHTRIQFSGQRSATVRFVGSSIYPGQAWVSTTIGQEFPGIEVDIRQLTPAEARQFAGALYAAADAADKIITGAAA